jgi:hypothetical protein
MNINNIINIKYICIFLLFIIYYIYGLTLSKIIDYIFPEHNNNLPDYRIGLELVGEIGVTYLIYFTLRKYSESMINIFFKRMSYKIPFYLNQLLLIAFSFGIFKYLKKSNDKISYFKEKFINKIY